MRQSRYTVAVDGNAGTHLLYNTANGAFEVLDEIGFESFKACEGAIAQRLAERGFLTELTPDEEVAILQANFEAQRTDHDELTLVLAPTYACNLRCPYCYEIGHNAIKGKMNDRVIDSIVAFIGERYAAHPFKRLAVQWYGGDPSLALDVVEELSSRLIAFCDARGASYEATMLTNCNAIDEEAVDMLVRNRVTSVFITIDGFEETHNARRVSAVGTNSYERTVEAAKLFVSHGVRVIANMNVDRVNMPQYRPLREYLKTEAGIELSCARLCDYGHFFGTRDFKKPAFDLLDHGEFCKMAHDEFVSAGFDAHQVEAVLSPAPRFCKGQKDDYFVIDTRGDIYLCDGYIGEQDHIVGNVVSKDYDQALSRISHDPYADAQCRACPILPLCQGNCDWERRASGMVCHPLLSMLPDYLRDWQAALDEYEVAR